LQQSDRRVGRDGRVRPVDGATGRLRAAEVVRYKPDATLREIAQAAGVSPMTARDVRERLERGDPPTTSERSYASRAATGEPRRAAKSRSEPTPDPMVILQGLRRDPSLRQSETGRALLRWLDLQVRSIASFPRGVDQAPPHSRYVLAELAHAFAFRWGCLANELDRASGEGH
jgi:hypothetical protein